MYEDINFHRAAVADNIAKSFINDFGSEDTFEKGKWNVGDTKVYQGVTWEVGGFNAKGTPLWRKKKDQSGSSSGGASAASAPMKPVSKPQGQPQAPSSKPVTNSGSAVKSEHYDYLRKKIGKDEPGGVAKNWHLEIKFSNGEYDALAVKKLPSGREIRRYLKSKDGQNWRHVLPPGYAEKYGKTSSNAPQSSKPTNTQSKTNQTKSPTSQKTQSAQSSDPKEDFASKLKKESNLYLLEWDSPVDGIWNEKENITGKDAANLFLNSNHPKNVRFFKNLSDFKEVRRLVNKISSEYTGKSGQDYTTINRLSKELSNYENKSLKLK